MKIRNNLISSYTKHSVLPLLKYANQIKTNKYEYLLKNTIDGNKHVLYVLVSLQKHVDDLNYTEIDYILINGNTRYESSLPQ